MTKRFGIDIDGTVTCPTSLIPYINEAFHMNISLDDITEYEITDCLDIPKNDFYNWFIQSEPAIYAESPLAEGAADTLSRWHGKHELYFISARAQHLLDVTEKWFKDHLIHYQHIELIGSHNKVGTAEKYDIDLFFEDKHDNAVAIHEQLGIPVILFDTPYNRKPAPDGVIRVYSWQEAEQWVEQWEKTGSMKVKV